MTVQVHSQADWDVFVSYSRSDAHKINPLVSALRAIGLRVFVDDTAIDDFTSITRTIAEALAHCKALLALYSADYPQRRACQWELTYAYLAGQHEGDPRRRALVINPEHSAEHVHPVELRDARHWPWPATQQAVEQMAESVADHVTSITTPLGEHAGAPLVRWLPAPARTGSVHFVGRIAEQWRIHTALHRHRAPLVGQTSAGRAAQLRGMAGIGKTLLAQEYALRFGSAFTGGIFWFDLHSHDGQSSTQVMAAYEEQVATVLFALGAGKSADSLPGKLSHLALALEERGMPCLWIVDGVPDGLADDQLHLLRGPHMLTATLITTRSWHYSGFAEYVDVTPLPETDGIHLLTSRRTPHSELDHGAATALVRDVDGHPQALDLLATLAAHSDFVHVRNRLHAPGTDILVPRTKQAEPMNTVGDLPPLVGVLSRPLTGVPATDDVLRLFALACPAPLSQNAVENVLSAVPPYDPWEVASLVNDSVETMLGSGLLRPDPDHQRTWTIHPLLARAVRRHDVDTARQEDLRSMLLHTLTPPPNALPSATAPRTTKPTGTPRAVPAGAAPGSVERAAAFDLQVELVTRVGVQPLEAEQGSLREALTSLYSVFATSRETLHRMANERLGPLVLPAITADLLNTHLRPFLATWHPALQAHETNRPPDISPVAHERRWERAPEMRAALEDLRSPLTSTVRELAQLCGVDLLIRRPADE